MHVSYNEDFGGFSSVLSIFIAKGLKYELRMKVKVFIGANHEPDSEWQVLAGEQGQQRPGLDSSEKDSVRQLKTFPKGTYRGSCSFPVLE